MIYSIKGNVIHLDIDFLVIENNSVGYKLKVTSETINKIENSEKQYLIYTEMIVREDDISLFGFYDLEEKRMFNLLRSVSGIGPKVALGILSSINYNELAVYILNQDEKNITKAKGVGKKGAQRIVLDLKDKVSGFEIDISNLKDNKVLEIKSNNEAVEALQSLGYNKFEAQKLLDGIDETLGLDEIIKLALQRVNFR